MGALADGRGWVQPDFGAVVRRRALVDCFMRTRPARTLLVAPGGYGKSVLAAQFAAAVEFDACLWVDLNGASPCLDDVLHAIYRVACTGTENDYSPLGAPSSGASLLLDVEGLISSWTGQTVCLVLDNITELVESRTPSVVLETLRRCTSPGSRLIITARRAEQEGESGSDSWYLESRELLLDADESRELVRLLVGDQATESQCGHLIQASGGQVALFCVAARHLSLAAPGFNEKSSAPADLASYLMHLALSHLSPCERRVLLIASMLGGGASGELLLLSGREGDYASLSRVAECIPLLRLSRGHSGSRFQMHEYAAEVYTDSERLLHLESTIESVVPRVLDYMESTGELERMFRLLLRMGCAEEIESRLERTGLDLLNQGHGALLLELLENVQAARMISCPQLLLVKAMALRHVRQFDEALRLAKVARTVSTTAKNGEHVGVQAAIVMARVFVDLGQYEAIIECLRDVMESQVLLDDSNAHCLALGYLAAAYASTGNTEIALETTSRAREMLKRPGIAVQARCATSMCCAGALVILLGDFRTSGDMMGNLAMDPNVPLSFATQARGNLAATLCEIGQVHRALDIAREASLQCRNMGLMVLAESFMGTEAAALAGLGEMSDAAAMMRRCLDASAASGDVYSGELERNYLGAILRANGKRDEALAESERSYAYFSANSSDFVVDVGWAEVELAASLLAVGDVASAVRHAEHALTLFEGLGAPHHVLRCHLVLAEIARLSNQVRQAHDWLLGDSEYLCSGNGNWLLAMYIRAFPGLLGLVAAAVGVDRLPVHMLRMIMPEHARAALPLARDVLDEDSWRRLAVRLLGEDEALALESSFLGKPLVHVRLFGGLEVVTPEGVVPDRAWKKRKARLLFMMLVTRQGRDVPRDMLLEHLWPDMDEERAKNNFYVIWSAMKRALLPAGKAAPCPYVEHVGGICRAVRPLVRSDLDDFDESVAALNKAEAAGCLADVLGAGRRIREIYRSDLLPSELYDDWFRPLRERYRVQFGDTMLRVGRMCRDADDLEQAVQFTRAGLEHDPWREDLYQAAIRYQIDTGQRSGAVDMFMTCRAKLAEDLGLDPSVETRRLYEEVLAMEESSQR